MAPGLLSTSVFDLLGVVDVTVSVNATLLDLTLRGLGLVIFLVLLVKNRRKLAAETTHIDESQTPEEGSELA
jgi:hypothetical protein